MKFSAFYLLAGALAATGVIKTSSEASAFGLLFLAAIACCALGALFEACNPNK